MYSPQTRKRVCYANTYGPHPEYIWAKLMGLNYSKGYISHSMEKRMNTFPNRKLNIPDVLRFRMSFVKPKDIIILVCVAAISAGISFVLPVFTKYLTGDILESRDMNLFFGISVFIAATELTSQLIRLLRTTVSGRLQLDLRKKTEEALMDRILSLPISFFRGYPAGELYVRMNAVGDLGDIFSDGLIIGVISALSSLVFVGQIVNFAPRLTIPSVIIIVLSAAISLMAVLLKKRIETEQRYHEARENGVSLELIRNASKIKLSGAEERAYKNWEAHYLKSIEKKYDPPALIKISPALLMAIKLFGAILIYYIAARSEITVSDYLAFNTAYGGLLAGVSALSDIGLQFASVTPVYELAKPILEAVPEDNTGKKIVQNKICDIKLDHVSFGYEKGKTIINDISLHIKPKEFVAIAGKTGCGKTTLIRLILGLEKPDSGRILYDGIDQSEVDLKSLRKNMGAVIQDGRLFRDDILNNIIIGYNELDESDAWEAAHFAGIDEEIRELPLGMHTPIAENSADISGGQKQRILIARAFAHKPGILIFDEATSALNEKMQQDIMEAVGNMDATRIVVAHRISAIHNADRLIYMEDGKIVKTGTFEELSSEMGFADLLSV